MAAAPWNDHRFRSGGERSNFHQTFTSHKGVTHDTMQAAGFIPKDQRASAPAETLARSLKPMVALPASLKPLPAAHTVDPRFPAGSGLGPRWDPTGMEQRRKRTQELDISRGVSGGAFHAPVTDMRPAGMSRAHRAEVVMRGWHAYKHAYRNMDGAKGQSLTASCPDLQALVLA
eukprot:TRINITY_DN82794_c0_g1_i1.p1 TRINITY_DN82794_c0_g1~~TRINITY_DN82794_c0_g1_i1.p1  ORF type:complete len:174 (+),score=19.40 TRINITY_DN82794_c0_g1_i1:73-594(+)